MNQTSSSNFNKSDAKAQLKRIGDQIESIAKNWENQEADIDCQGLYDLGDQVEHFLDDENFDSQKESGSMNAQQNSQQGSSQNNQKNMSGSTSSGSNQQASGQQTSGSAKNQSSSSATSQGNVSSAGTSSRNKEDYKDRLS